MEVGIFNKQNLAYKENVKNKEMGNMSTQMKSNPKVLITKDILTIHEFSTKLNRTNVKFLTRVYFRKLNKILQASISRGFLFKS